MKSIRYFDADFKQYAHRTKTELIVIHRFGVIKNLGVDWLKDWGYIEPKDKSKYRTPREAGKYLRNYYISNKEVVEATGSTKIPYHYAIGPHGESWGWLPPSLAADGTVGYDNVSIQIGVYGDFRSELPNACQMSSLAGMCEDIMHKHGLGIDCIVGHTDIPNSSRNKSKVCPGAGVTDFIKADLSTRLG